MIRRIAVVSLIAALAAAGCSGGGGGGNPVAPWPPPGSTPETEPNDSSPQSLGTLDATDKLVAATAGGRNDVDLFSVTLPSTGSIFMSLSWTGSQDLEVGVTDVNGVVVRNQDTPTGNPEQCTVTGQASGTYRVRVGSRSSTAVNYLLTIGKR